MDSTVFRFAISFFAFLLSEQAQCGIALANVGGGGRFNFTSGERAGGRMMRSRKFLGSDVTLRCKHVKSPRLGRVSWLKHDTSISLWKVLMEDGYVSGPVARRGS